MAITDPDLHTKIKLPDSAYMFQYGISTNNLYLTAAPTYRGVLLWRQLRQSH